MGRSVIDARSDLQGETMQGMSFPLGACLSRAPLVLLDLCTPTYTYTRTTNAESLAGFRLLDAMMALLSMINLKKYRLWLFVSSLRLVALHSPLVEARFPVCRKNVPAAVVQRFHVFAFSCATPLSVCFSHAGVVNQKSALCCVIGG